MATDFGFPDLLNPLAGAESTALQAVDPDAAAQAKIATTILNPLATTEATAFRNPTDFLNALSSRNTLMRLAEGALGILLIIAGIAKLADGTPVGSALKKVPLI
jgi:hypothetical protein